MILNLSSGTPLNFKIISRNTKEELLSTTPTVNTVGAVTDYVVSSWVLSPTEPPIAEDGMLWIVTGNGSPARFNALKRNCIQIFPVAVKHYISGAWTERTAYLYTESGWVQVGYQTVYLYRNGDRNFEITGDFHLDSPTGTLVPDGVDAEGNTYLDFFSMPDGEGLYQQYTHYTGKMIDVTPFRYLVETGYHMRHSDTIGLVDESGNSVAQVKSTVESGTETLRLDISQITGSYYLVFYNLNNGYDNWDMYELYLSPE